MVELDSFENKDIVVALPNESTYTLSLTNPTTTFIVYNNGTYTVTATTEGSEAEKSIDITNIIDKTAYDLAKEDEIHIQ